MNSNQAPLSRGRFIAEVAQLVRLTWSVFWKVTLGLSCLAVLLWVLLNSHDTPFFSLNSLLGCVIIFAYALVGSAWIGLILALFVVSWRFFGGWILIPVIASLGGAITAVGIGILLLIQRAPLRGGLHGGGEIVLAIILAGLGVLAAVGGVLGAIGGTALAVGLASVTRARQGMNPSFTHFATDKTSTDQPTPSGPES